MLKIYIYWHKCSKSIQTGINAQNLNKWLPNWDNPRGSSLQELIKSNLLLESRADQNTFPRFVDVFELLVLSRRAVTGSKQARESFLLCCVWRQLPVMREGKWAASYSDIPQVGTRAPFQSKSKVIFFLTGTPYKVLSTERLIQARLGVSRTIYVNVDSPTLGSTYFNFLVGAI